MDINEIVIQGPLLKTEFSYVVMLDMKFRERNINISSDLKMTLLKLFVLCTVILISNIKATSIYESIMCM